MRLTVRVDNHRPVPLRPLAEVLDELADGDPVYVGPYYGVAEYEGEWTGEEPLGWCRCQPDRHGGLLNTVDGDTTYDYWLENFDLARTLARPLQPGERLVVEYEG